MNRVLQGKAVTIPTLLNYSPLRDAVQHGDLGPGTQQLLSEALEREYGVYATADTLRTVLDEAKDLYQGRSSAASSGPSLQSALKAAAKVGAGAVMIGAMALPTVAQAAPKVPVEQETHRLVVEGRWMDDVMAAQSLPDASQTDICPAVERPTSTTVGECWDALAARERRDSVPGLALALNTYSEAYFKIALAQRGTSFIWASFDRALQTLDEAVALHDGGASNDDVVSKIVESLDGFNADLIEAKRRQDQPAVLLSVLCAVTFMGMLGTIASLRRR